MRRGGRRAHRPDQPRRMERQHVERVLAGGLTQPALQFDALHQRRQHVAAGRAAHFRQRQCHRQSGGKRMVRRAPHRLEIQHMHRRAVQRRGAHRIDAEVAADHRCHRRAAQRAHASRQNRHGVFLCHAGNADREPVQHQPPRRGNRFGRQVLEARRGDALAQCSGQAHGCNSSAPRTMRSCAAKHRTKRESSRCRPRVRVAVRVPIRNAFFRLKTICSGHNIRTFAVSDFSANTRHGCQERYQQQYRKVYGNRKFQTKRMV